jgi:hypothetical protein
MWFEKEYLKTLTLDDLHNFLEKLIEKRSKQIINANKGYATFYLWYNPQSACLSFDILSGTNIKLPFGCKLNIIQNPLTVLSTFLKEEQADITSLSWENFKIINPGDPGWDNDDDNNDDWIQDVYVTTLPQPTFAKFIKKIIS